MSDEYMSNYRKLTALFAAAGRDSLLCAVDFFVPRNFFSTFSQSETTASKLCHMRHNNILSETQFNLLSSGNVTADSLDVGLLFLMLRYVIESVGEPTNGWNKDPAHSDYGIAADLLRLRKFRNEAFFRPVENLHEDHFEEIWDEVKTFLVRIVENSDLNGQDLKNKIKTIKKTVYSENDVQRYRQQIVSWCEADLNAFEGHLHNAILSGDEIDARRQRNEPAVETDLESLTDEFRSISTSTTLERVRTSGPSSGGQAVRSQIQTLTAEIEAARRCLQRLTLNQLPRERLVWSQQPIREQQQEPIIRHSSAQEQRTRGFTDKEIYAWSMNIGQEFLQLMVQLDYSDTQKYHLRSAYPNDSLEQIYQMLKSWYDVVVRCGEDPRQLLAAALVNVGNNLLASELIPDWQLKDAAFWEAKETTKKQIRQIVFGRHRYQQITPTGIPVVNQGADNSINVFGGGTLVLGSESEVSLTGGPTACKQTTAASELEVLANAGGGVYNFAGNNSLNVMQEGNVHLEPRTRFTIGSRPDQVSDICHSELDGNLPLVQGTSNIPVDSSTSRKRNTGFVRVTPNSSVSLSGGQASNGMQMKRPNTYALNQHTMDSLASIMKSVGILMFDMGESHQEVGTVFRVGRIWVMTALHMLKKVLDPCGNGVCLENLNETYIVFGDNPQYQLHHKYRINTTYHQNETMDIAVLEITNPDDHLPNPLPLQKRGFVDHGNIHVYNIGYGHSESREKHIDIKCQTVHPNSVIQSMQFVGDNSQTYKNDLIYQHKNPSLVDKGYCGYDEAHKLLLHTSMEFGGSGAPVIQQRGTHFIVIGVFLGALPEFYFHLSESVKKDFPNNHRIEYATRTEIIYEELQANFPELATELFP